MALTWPEDCNTPGERIEYCYRAQELLRVLHNKMGVWYKNGEVTEAQYENLLPQKIKDRYPYVAQLSQSNWNDFTENVFTPISGRIVEKLLQQRELLFVSTTWGIDVEDI